MNIISCTEAFKKFVMLKGRIPHVYIFNVWAFEYICYKRAHTMTTITLNDNKYNSHMFKHLNDNCYQIINMPTI
jgi:hypothetical protein